MIFLDLQHFIWQKGLLGFDDLHFERAALAILTETVTKSIAILNLDAADQGCHDSLLPLRISRNISVSAPLGIHVTRRVGHRPTWHP